MLGQVNASLLGIVLNSVTGENSYDYSGAYRYIYSQELRPGKEANPEDSVPSRCVRERHATADPLVVRP
ncbi:MAG: hypothetical protein WKF43_10160 [Acidimicrobiales bacterium]